MSGGIFHIYRLPRFPVTLENAHVIEQPQLFAAVVGGHHDSEKFTLNYDVREKCC